MWPLTDEKTVIISKLPMDEFLNRLRANMDPTMSLLGSRAVIGSIDGTKVRLRKRIAYRNSFQTFLSANVWEHDGRTRATCRFSLHPFVFAFMAVWFAILASGLLFAVAQLLVSGRQGPLAGIAIPLGMLVFGYLLVHIGCYLARDERAFLTKFLSEL